MTEEEIIILEANDDEDSSSRKDVKKKSKTKLDKNKKLIIIASSILAFLIIAISTILIITGDSEEQVVSDINTSKIVDKLNQQKRAPQFSPSHLENMIKKANVLYEGGNKKEALKIFKRISSFNEGISYYNIGVAKMKEENFEEALESFKKAIENEEQRTVSAINAAVCALELGKTELFKYYIDLAFAYLPTQSNAPLFSYYVGLINYYKDYYYEALTAFSHTSSEYYRYEQNYLSSKILASIEQSSLAVNVLEKKSKLDDSLTLGLLYARLGEFNTAQNYLLKALSNTQNPLHAKAALLLVQNRLGELESSSQLMEELYSQYEDNATKVYPIKTILKNTLFDINEAQEEFEKTLFFDDKRTYSLLFYFAPFKVFDAKQTINYIRKGGINIFIDEIQSALSNLSRSSTISKVNLSISAGIKKALNHHTEQAKQIFSDMISIYPKHSILHYNLALTYAQMADFGKAFKHFRTSYNLDNNNYLAGAFAIMSGELIKEDITKLKENVKQSMMSDLRLKKQNLYMSLIHLTENNQLALTRWLEQEKEKTPFTLMFDTIIAQKIFNEKKYRQKATMLKSILPRDIMANIIYFNMKHEKSNIKDYARAIQIDFRSLDLNNAAFYYGPRIVQESYVKLLQIGGLLHHERESLVEKMQLEKKDIAAIMQTLAYVSIYTHNFEEAYILYNKLIDDLEKRDSATIFLAAVASIGAGHSENAVALLELSKLTNPKNYEARYALGLLYQEIRNWEGAAIQYRKIGNSGFKSKYFSFEVTR